MIKYVIGDATEPVTDRAMIVHICNDVGVWGAGFVMALSKKWPEPESKYRAWYEALQKPDEPPKKLPLGDIQIVEIPGTKMITVVNMIAQRMSVDGSGKLVSYDHLVECLLQVRDWLWKDESVHMPRIGAGIGGGDWDIIEKIIEKTLKGVNVYVYDLPPKGPDTPRPYMVGAREPESLTIDGEDVEKLSEILGSSEKS